MTRMAFLHLASISPFSDGSNSLLTQDSFAGDQQGG